MRKKLRKIQNLLSSPEKNGTLVSRSKTAF